jgi:hypothetical protein
MDIGISAMVGCKTKILGRFYHQTVLKIDQIFHDLLVDDMLPVLRWIPIGWMRTELIGGLR